MQRFKDYRDILWNSKVEKEAFFDKLEKLLATSKKKRQSKKSKREFAERFASLAIHTFWEVAWERMIYDGDYIPLYADKARVSISMLPYRHNDRVLKAFLKNPIIVPFFSRRTHNFPVVYFRLKCRFRGELRKQIKEGHEYKFGKPMY